MATIDKTLTSSASDILSAAAVSLRENRIEGLLAEDTDITDFRTPAAIFASPAGRRAINLRTSVQRAALIAALHHDPAAVTDSGLDLIAVLPPIYPEWLGGRTFTTFHDCRFPYVVGAMAQGITTAAMVSAASRHGFMAFFGAAGLRPDAIASAIDEIRATVEPGAPWGSNLIHAPDRPEREREVVDLYLQRGVDRVSASAFMQLSSDVVRYSARGLAIDATGEVVRQTHVFAKISRPEVAEQFISPPKADILRELAAAGAITEQQAELQSRLPVAEDITVEADSGGHTDNRPLTVLFPVIAALRDRLAEKLGFSRPIRLGAAGGLGSPHAVAAAFGLGADYVLTGSINQAAVESGLSQEGREILARCSLSDVMMAPAADMFERGIKVQVVKSGTTFAVKAQRLYDLFRRFTSVDELAPRDRDWLEQQVLRQSWAEAWSQTRQHCETSRPELIPGIDSDARRQMALVFRRYLFMGSEWARQGDSQRRLDYQIWCGPAIGAFNDWVCGSFLEPIENRTVGQIGLNLLEGACSALRAEQFRLAGVDFVESAFAFTPKRLAI
jgi:trans-AT polyketide synthase, acyltransferase and oxidoreductase domains